MTVFHEGDGDESGFTCCAFSARERFLMLGTCFGRLNLYDVSSGEKVANYNCHTSAITHLELSRVGPVSCPPAEVLRGLLALLMMVPGALSRMRSCCSPLRPGVSLCLLSGTWTEASARGNVSLVHLDTVGVTQPVSCLQDLLCR